MSWSARDLEQAKGSKRFREELTKQQQADEAARITSSPEFQQQQREASERIIADDLGRESYLAGGKDTAFVLPADAAWYDGSSPDRSIPRASLIPFLQLEAEKFAQQNPDYFKCQESFSAISDFALRHGFIVLTAATYKAIWERLRSFGLIKVRPVEVVPEIPAAPEPTAEELREQRRRAYYEDKTFLFDAAGRGYSESEVDGMSADQLGKLLPRINTTVTVASQAPGGM